jgi:hypothetical protein
MTNFGKVLTELRQERSRLDEAIQAIGNLVGGSNTKFRPRDANRPKRTLSARARRKIAAAQRARWAKWKSEQRKKAA